MQIEKMPDYVKNEEENSGTATALVDGVPHVVVNYYDPSAEIQYRIFRDGVEVEEPRAKEIHTAYSAELQNFVDDVLSQPPLEAIE